MSESLENNKLNSLGYLTGKVHALLKQRLNDNLFDKEIPLKAIHYPVISRLWETDDVSQQTIAEWMNFDRHRTSRLIDELEAGNLVERHASDTNKREKRIRLTKYGKALRKPVLEIVGLSIGQAMQGMNEEEKEYGIKFLQKVVKNLI